MLTVGLLLLLCVGHVVADLILQPPLLAAGKRSVDTVTRWRWLALHGAAHGFMVALVLSPALALAEAVLHPLIDRAKGRGWFGDGVDQALHFVCKVVWVGVYLGWLL